jgi:succinyl-CoA synthetase alpha subunit
MISGTRLRRNEYRDSGTLMSLAAKLQALPGITRAAAIMATPKNVELLTSMGFASEPASPADLLIVVEGLSQDAVDLALNAIDALLERRTGFSPSGRAQARPTSPPNLAVISVPGPFAAREARRALRAGQHVFLFSNNVPLADELALKREARERSLLVMGPDCGTAILDGTPIGFANRVRRGAIGIVGASGTGIQEISALVHRLGHGVSHAIGTGSRDLSDAVGGSSTMHGIDLLARDEVTEVIVLVSKPPSPAVAARVREHAQKTGKRIVECFLGGEKTLEDAAFEACGLPLPDRRSLLADRPVFGLFSGGTLATEARRITKGDVTDLGEDEYTRGRPHPMIDPTIRIERIAHVPPEAVLLIDVVLGEGAHPDPAGALIAALVQRGGATYASVTGTDDDPQHRASQVRKLREAGVIVCRSNAAAARGDESELPPAAETSSRTSSPILGAPLVAVNLGLDSFADTFEQVIRTDWRPPAGGDEELARILDALL